MVTNSKNRFILPIPNFLREYLCIGNDGTVYSSDAVNYFFYPRMNSGISNEQKINFFKEFYSLAKERLGLLFNRIENDNEKLLIDTEIGFLNYQIADIPYFSFSIVLDIPIYWYDNSNEKLGCSILETGVRISFSSFDISAGASPFAISLNYFYNLFSNHVATWDSHGTVKPELYYFAPAAKLNRLHIRNFALESKIKFPELVVEFSTDEGRVYPRDEFGFLEGAEIIINPEKLNSVR